jgi:hypothetical protein
LGRSLSILRISDSLFSPAAAFPLFQSTTCIALH